MGTDTKTKDRPDPSGGRPAASARRLKHSRLQRLLRGGVCLVLTCTAAAATLPWWAPTALVADYLARQLSRTAGADVRITGVTLSWSDGLGIEGLTVAGGPGRAILRVERVRCDMNPLTLLATGRPDWLELHRPVLLVTLADDGTHNLAPLERLTNEWPAPPRVSIHQGRITAQLPSRPRPMKLDVANVQVLTDDDGAARVTMSASLAQDARPATLSMVLRTDAERRARQIELTFSGLAASALGDLAPARGYPRALRGTCTGKLSATISDAGVVENAAATLKATDLADEAGEIADRLAVQVAFRATGRDGGQATAKLTAPGMTAEAAVAFTAGLADLHELARAGGAITTASWPHVRAATTGRLAVRVTGGKLLARLWPELAEEWRTAGPHRRGAELNVALLGLGKTEIETDIRLGPGGRAKLDGSITDVTALAAEFEAILHRPAGEQIRTALRHLRLAGTVRVADVEAAGRLYPPLAARLAGWPIKGAAVTVDIDHVGPSAAEAADGGYTCVAVDAEAPGRGRASLDVGLSDPPAFWPAAIRMLDAPTRANALGCLAHLFVAGELRVEDLALVEPIGPEAAAALKGVKLNGQAIGARFEHDPETPLTLRSDIAVPAGVEMAVGNRFAKPTQAPALLTLGGTIADETTLSDISARLTVGKAGLAVTDGLVQLTPPPAADKPGAAPARIRASGNVVLSNVEAVAACFPQAAKHLPADLFEGTVGGKFAVDLAAGQLRLAHVTADLRDLAVNAGEVFVKPAAQQARITLALSHAEGADAAYRFTLTGECDYAKAEVEAHLPALARVLGAGRLSGKCTFGGTGKWQGGRGTGEFHVDATPLALVSSGKVRPQKRPGVGARIDLAASFAANGDDVTFDRLDATARLGASKAQLHAVGAVDLRAVRDGRASWHDVLRRWDVTLDATAAIDAPLLDLAPELAEPARQYAIEGTLGITANMMAEYDELGVAVTVDAGRLAGRADLAALARRGGLKGDPAERLAALGHVVKPLGRPAEASLAFTLPRDLSHVRIDEFEASAGNLTATAAGRIDLGKTGTDTKIEERPALCVDPSSILVSVPVLPAAMALEGRVSLQCDEDLLAMVPGLKPYRPAGRVRADIAYTRSGPGDRCTVDATLTLAKFGGRYRGQDVRLDGKVHVTGAAPAEDLAPSARRVWTDGLDIRAAGSHAAVVADLANLPGAPSGSITLLGENIDAVALEKWLSPTGEVASWPEGRLTPAAGRALRAEADKTVVKLARLAADANVELRVRVNRLRVRDVIVEETYDASQLRLDASIRRGRVRGRYATSVSGGTMSGRFAVSLGDPEPVVSARRLLRGALGTKNMAPQMHHFFPGNTPGGTFNRVEALRWPLRDLLASQRDPRLRLTPTGSAETVTTDGVLEATAATGTMAHLFPSLKLTRYHYTKMTAFSTFRPDGTAVNDMIFDGRDYGLYMTGTTDAAGRADYESGLLAFGWLQSHRWQHRYRQGRVPLFRFRAQLYRRKFTDITVDYYWPHQSLGTILLENNILYRMWSSD